MRENLGLFRKKTERTASMNRLPGDRTVGEGKTDCQSTNRVYSCALGGTVDGYEMNSLIVFPL